jgi:hypothetical protein
MVKVYLKIHICPIIRYGGSTNYDTIVVASLCMKASVLLSAMWRIEILLRIKSTR